MNRPIPMTDAQGRELLPTGHLNQPHPSSVVLTHGEHGTAFQRYFNDGLWRRVGSGQGRTWEWLMTQRNVVLVYDAPEREPVVTRGVWRHEDGSTCVSYPDTLNFTYDACGEIDCQHGVLHCEVRRG